MLTSTMLIGVAATIEMMPSACRRAPPAAA
jgi:hypothetical protein